MNSYGDVIVNVLKKKKKELKGFRNTLFGDQWGKFSVYQFILGFPERLSLR